MQELESI